MDSSGKSIQKHYRFPFFSLPREVRDLIYRTLFITDGFVEFNYSGRNDFIDETCETLKAIYEATTSLRFIQESLQTFFRENYFIVRVADMPYVLNYGSLSLRTKEQFSVPPYNHNPEIAIQLSTASTLGQRPVMYPAEDAYWDAGEDEEIEFLVTDEAENFSRLTLRKASDMSTWIRSIVVSFDHRPYRGNLEHCLLELCKLPNLQHVTILTQANEWPLVQRRQHAASACLKELQLRFGKGLRLIYFSDKKMRWWRVPDSFINSLYALTDTGEGANEWEEDWLEEQFHPFERRSVDCLRSC